SFVDRGEAGRDNALGHCQIVLRRVQVLFRRQHGREVSCPELPLYDRKAERGIGRGDALAQEIDLFAALQKARQPILDFLLRLQNRVLIIDQERLQTGIFDPDLVGDLPVIEDVPLERRSKGEGYAAPLEDPLELASADVAGGRAKSSG